MAIAKSRVCLKFLRGFSAQSSKLWLNFNQFRKSNKSECSSPDAENPQEISFRHRTERWNEQRIYIFSLDYSG